MTSCYHILAKHTIIILQKTCPNSLRFSTGKQECDWPTSVQCGTRPVTSTETGAGNQCSCFAGISKCYKTDISSCNQFYVCVNGTQYNHKCPSGQRTASCSITVLMIDFYGFMDSIEIILLQCRELCFQG